MTIEEELNTLLVKIRFTIFGAKNQEAEFPELFRIIRESDAWVKYIVYKMMKISDTKNVIPASDKNRVFNDYVKSKEDLVKSFNRESKNENMNLDYIIRDIIYYDTQHLDKIAEAITQVPAFQ